MKNLSNNLTFKEAVDLTKEIIKRFEKIEGKPWKIEGSMIELSKQVGDLAKLVMVHEKYYFSDRDKLDEQYKSTKARIADELADILFVIIRIADSYDIDLVDAHLKARIEEDRFLKSKKV